jgi:3-oxoacyl-[acyl-carrier-protein] synthase II
MAAARLALQDAGLTQTEYSSCRASVIMGASNIDMEVTERELAVYMESGAACPTGIASASPHAAASEIARELNCSGTVLTFTVACSSGLVSIIAAVESILRGESDLVLAGGGDASVTPFFVNSLCATGVHPSNSGNGSAMASKPFDAQREGGVLTEGAGVVLVESLEHARQRGAHIYARVTGWGIANATSPKLLREAFASAMEQSLARAGLSPGMIDYVSAHAPGIQLSDRLEVQAIKDVFGVQAYNLAVGSIKSMIGNPMAASGPLQVIAAAQSIEHGYLPPTTNYQHPDPHCDLDFVPNLGRVARIRKVMVNSSGIGGCIASLIVTKVNPGSR